MTELTLVDRSRISGEPQWIERSVDPNPGADPLGLQTITTDRIIPRLAPGILALSSRARYFSFFAFVLEQAKRRRIRDQESLSRFMKEREYELALAVELCPRRCGAGPNGANRARPAVRSSVSAFERRESVDSHLGGYGLYYRSPMRTLALVAPAGTPYRDEVLPVDVLYDARGDGLAAAFEANVAETEYARRYLAGTEPVPRPVIEELAVRACLCRLDEAQEERLAIRDALLGFGGPQPADDVLVRREAFALLLRFIDEDPSVGRDAGLRSAVWRAFEANPTDDGSPLAGTVARWAALAARDYAQEAIANLWSDAGPGLARADRGWGLDRAAITAALASLIPTGTLNLPEGKVPVAPTMSTETFCAAVTEAAARTPLPDVARWAVSEGTAMAGLALLFAIYARLPVLEAPAGDWRIIGSISGDRQPGLLPLGHDLGRHIATAPSLTDTLVWAVRKLVLLPHEWTANSKVPEFTFRFRWESGRLTFFNYFERPFARFGLNDIRAESLTSLAVDLGLAEQGPGLHPMTTDGRSFVDEVFPA